MNAVAPTRITLSRAKGWRKPEGAIVVSRPSIWGNPWKPGKPGTFWLSDWGVSNDRIGSNLSAKDCVDLFYIGMDSLPIWPVDLPAALTSLGHESCLRSTRAHFDLILSRLPELRGHDLCCWCKPGEPCHADWLIWMANA